jgi:predicted lipid-binding transport protein (Tim44 family)
VASPDTEELATVPLPTPAGAPDLETIPQERAEPEPVEAEQAEREQVAEPDSDARAEESKDGGRWWRGLTGSLAAGLALLAAGVLGVAGICLFTGAPGPGPAMLIGHPVAAVLAVIAQRVADRRNGPPAAAAGLVVVLLTVSALTLFWLT